MKRKSPVSSERAKGNKKPRFLKRAKPTKKSNANKRARVRESPKSPVRAKTSESPKKIERAKEPEQPTSHELILETRNELIDKIIKTYELQETRHVAEAVEIFYDVQKLRIMHANKLRIDPPCAEPPSELSEWLNKYLLLGEHVMAGKLKKWVLSDRSPAEAKWAYAQVGIGPIIAGGLAAHIDPAKANTPSAVWKFAGLAPKFDKRSKGQKIPFNLRLKVLTWKAGESFVKVSGKENAFYGEFYAKYKADEVSRNENGHYREAAARELATKKFSDNDTKKRLLEGKLSDGHLHSRAKRRTVKLFLCHYWIKGRKARGLDVRLPYPMQILGHDGMIEPPPP
jgi:hypothetical protein